MANWIGLKRSWFQNKRGRKPPFPHYDLSPQKRKMAIKRGAIEITCRELVILVRDHGDIKDGNYNRKLRR